MGERGRGVFPFIFFFFSILLGVWGLKGEEKREIVLSKDDVLICGSFENALGCSADTEGMNLPLATCHLPPSPPLPSPPLLSLSQSLDSFTLH